jgi:hypothetical protein
MNEDMEGAKALSFFVLKNYDQARSVDNLASSLNDMGLKK